MFHADKRLSVKDYITLKHKYYVDMFNQDEGQ